MQNKHLHPKTMVSFCYEMDALFGTLQPLESMIADQLKGHSPGLNEISFLKNEILRSDVLMKKVDALMRCVDFRLGREHL